MTNIVTAESVRKAVLALVDRDIVPTYDAVLGELGGGSRRDIHKFLRPLLDELEMQKRESKDANPELIKARSIGQEAVDRIYRLVRHCADERIDSIQRAESDKLLRRQEDLDTARAACRKLESEIHILKSSKEEAEKRAEEFRERMLRAEAVAVERANRLTAEGQAKEQLQSRLEQAMNEAAELKGQLAARKRPAAPTNQQGLFDDTAKS